jgi:hypothetical protein
MNHVVLLGDSIFDNAAYVPGHPPVIEQVRGELPAGWKATLVAVDGHTVEDIAVQLPRIPPDASHLVVSIGGNDALGCRRLLPEPAATVAQALAVVAEALEKFREAYTGMLQQMITLGKPLCLCTIYDTIPGLSACERAALAGFNDVITRAAAAFGLPVIDLRVICNQVDDYSPVSPIEPSVAGGAKIADAIGRVIATHDFTAHRAVVYTQVSKSDGRG